MLFFCYGVGVFQHYTNHIVFYIAKPFGYSNCSFQFLATKTRLSLGTYGIHAHIHYTASFRVVSRLIKLSVPVARALPTCHREGWRGEGGTSPESAFDGKRVHTCRSSSPVLPLLLALLLLLPALEWPSGQLAKWPSGQCTS